MTEDEVNEKREKILNRRQKVFCPLINDTCRLDCEGFFTPRKIRRYKQNDGWILEGGYCTAGALQTNRDVNRD